MKNLLIAQTLLFPFFTSNIEAKPVIATKLVQPYKSIDLGERLQTQERIFEAALSKVPFSAQSEIREFIEVSNKNIVAPRSYTKDELADIFCHERTSQRPSQNLGRVPLFACKDSESGRIFGGSSFAEDLPNPNNGRTGKKFAEFFYYINLVPPDYVTWHKFKILQFVTFSVEESLRNSSFETILTSKRLELFFERIFFAEFSKDITWLRLGRTALEFKSKEIPAGIGYVPSLGGLSVAEGLAGLTLSGGFPAVHLAATCAGTCVAVETSSFADVIGRYSYAWQIAFYSDIWTDFLSDRDGYNSVGGIGNQLWFVWADFVAGNQAEDSLRATQFFKQNLDPMVARLK